MERALAVTEANNRAILADVKREAIAIYAGEFFNRLTSQRVQALSTHLIIADARQN